jgi:hypothetical protein
MPNAALTRPVFGPTKPSRLSLMGIRFAEGDGSGDGSGAGAGGDDKNAGSSFTAPATQADLDKIINGAVARTHKQYEGFVKAEAPKQEQKQDQGAKSPEEIAEAAREEGRAEARAELAIERVNDALKSALKGRALDPAVLVLGFDKKQFVKDGAANSEAITKWVTDNSTEIKTGSGRDPGQGGRDSKSTGGSVQAGRDLYDDGKKPTNRKE